MTITQHPHAEHIAAIAQHLDNTPEATAPNQIVGRRYKTPDGANLDRMYLRADGASIAFAYSVWSCPHTTDIEVMVKRHDIKTHVTVPGDTPADVIAHTAMVVLRTAIDTITTTQ